MFTRKAASRTISLPLAGKLGAEPTDRQKPATGACGLEFTTANAAPTPPSDAAPRAPPSPARGRKALIARVAWRLERPPADHGVGAEAGAQGVDGLLARSGAALLVGEQVEPLGGVDEVGQAGADQPVVTPGRLGGQQLARHGEQGARRLGRHGQGAAAGDDAEVGGAQLQCRDAAGDAGLARGPRHPLAQRPEPVFQVVDLIEVVEEGRLGADRLAHLVRIDRAGVLALGQLRQAKAIGAPALGEVLGVRVRQIAHLAEARRLQRADEGGADAGQDGDGPHGQEGARLRRADDREAARLVEVGGDLGQELVGRQADGDGDADVPLDLGLQPGQHQGRAAAV